MQAQISTAYLAFQEVKNAFVSNEKVKRVVDGCERFLCFLDPGEPRPLAGAIRLAARAKHTELSEAEFDVAVLRTEARVQVLPTTQLRLF